MSTGTIDRQLVQPGRAGVNKTTELADICGMSLVGRPVGNCNILGTLVEPMERKAF
jgi:hypothetical protein